MGTRMTGTTTEGSLEGKPEEEQKKKKELKCWDAMMELIKSNGWIIDQSVLEGGGAYRREGGRLQGCNRRGLQNLRRQLEQLEVSATAAQEERVVSSWIS